MRALAALSVVLAVSAMPVSTADAAGESCRGRAATIVGEPDRSTTGTDGDDVIVTNGSYDVSAGAGDDVICVTSDGSTGAAVVKTDAGEDLVDTTATASFTTVVLGDGADELWGGDNGHEVVTGGTHDRETDRLRLGAGYDEVETGEPGRPDADEIDLGGGDGVIRVRSNRPTGLLHAAPGSGAELQLPALGRGRWVLDAAAGRATRNGTIVVRWENLAVHLLPTVRGEVLTYLGTDEHDWIDVTGTGALARVDMRAGFDRVEVHDPTPVSGTVDGGLGRDTLFVGLDRAGEVVADLRGGVLRVGAGHAGGRIAGFENADVRAASVRLHGTGGPNDLIVRACRSVVRGAGGHDVLSSTRTRRFEDSSCQSLTAGVSIRLLGGPGDDTLTGGFLPERLYGGPGFDRADGRGGHDVCRAEVEQDCES